MELSLVDSTYELFRHYYVVPSARDELDRKLAQCAMSWPRCWEWLRADNAYCGGHRQLDARYPLSTTLRG